MADPIGRCGAASCHVASLVSPMKMTGSPRRPRLLIWFAAWFGCGCAPQIAVSSLPHAQRATSWQQHLFLIGFYQCIACYWSRQTNLALCFSILRTLEPECHDEPLTAFWHTMHRRKLCPTCIFVSISLFSPDGICVCGCTTHPVSLAGSEVRVIACVCAIACTSVCVHVYQGIADMGPFGESQSKQVRATLGVLSVQC